jgi:predicted nucleotidyltransferase
MLLNNNKLKIIQLFFDDPIKDNIGFGLREISRLTKIAPPSTKKYLNELIKEKLVKIKKLSIGKRYFVTMNEEFISYKKIINLFNIKQSGLIKELEKHLPDCIILFGSYHRGEDHKKSDIDIFMQKSYKEINLDKYEKILKKPINIIFDKKFTKLSSEFKNEIIQGTILSGYLKVF